LLRRNSGEEGKKKEKVEGVRSRQWHFLSPATEHWEKGKGYDAFAKKGKKGKEGKRTAHPRR